MTDPDEPEFTLLFGLLAVPCVAVGSVLLELSGPGKISGAAVFFMSFAFLLLIVGVLVDLILPSSRSSPAAPAPRRTAPLSVDDVDRLLAMVPEISDQTRAQVQLLLGSHLKDHPVLTAGHLDAILGGIAEVSEQTRAHVRLLLKAMLKEKSDA